MSATGPTSPPYTTLAFAFGHDLPLFTAPLSSYLTANPSPSGSPYEGIATGSFIINPRTSKLLLLRRAPHDSMPLCWEIPGGAVDVEDESILHGAARELFEETGLVATRITRQVGGVQEFLTRKGRRMGKVSFLVDVEVQDGEIKVKLDPNEHVQYVWVSLDEAKAKKVGDVLLEYTTEAQETTIYQAFRLWKEQTAGT